MKKLLSAPILMLAWAFSFDANAQHNHGVIPCFSDEHHEWRLANEPGYASAWAQGQEDATMKFNQLEAAGSGTESNPYIIPVVVHVMYHSELDNISDAQVEDAIRVINEDFRRLNADTSSTRPLFKGVATDMNIEFRLAKLDPNGNCTNGITRTQTPLAIAGNNNVKSLIAWDNKKYINIWTVRTIDRGSSTGGIVLGYATFPSPNNGPTTDGIVIRHDRMGSIGTAVSIGRTLTHEMGHMLNLIHPFQSGCFTGDQCSDTPPVQAANFGCPGNVNSCTNDVPDLIDQHENYMDYANDACMNMFTICQRQRAHAVLNVASLRGSLVTVANLAATGVEQNNVSCVPVADFTLDRTTVCAGQNIQFTNRSAKQSNESYLWSFPGGTPSTSTDPNPLVTYPTPGHYSVTLEIVGATNPTKKEILQAIDVRANYPEISGLFVEGFENTTIPFPWHSDSRGDRWNWEITQQAAATGSKSVYVNNFDIRTQGVSVSLISPGIDMRWTQNLTLRYKVAMARTANNNTDQLRILTSTDCGTTWQTKSVRAGFLLSTMPAPISASFFPNDPSQWREETLNLSEFANSPDHLIIRFELFSGGGNNIFLDDIQVDATLSDDFPITQQRTQVLVYPNPSNGDLRIAFSKLEKGPATIWITDLSGRTVASWQKDQIESGNHDFALPFDAQLSAGSYLLHLDAGQGIQTEKVTIW